MGGGALLYQSEQPFIAVSPHAAATSESAWIAVAHDLRTPLAALSIAVESVMEQTRGPRRSGARLFEVVRRNLILMERLIEDAQRVAQNETFERRPLDLLELLTELAGPFEPLLESRGQTLFIDHARRQRFVVHADRGALLRAMVNLIDNASKFGPHGDRIRVVLRRLPDEVLLEVCDHGPGIPVEERELVFRPYYRGRAAHDVFGSGLGLTAVRAVVLAHGGRVQIKRRRRETRVCIALPMPTVVETVERPSGE